jgi:hypothetical protein
MANSQESNRLDSVSPEMKEKNDLPTGSEGGYFEIHVRGYLNDHWSDWLEGLEMRLLDDGEMILSGSIVDQAALMGILNKLNRLNLTLLSVNEVKRKDGMEAK